MNQHIALISLALAAGMSACDSPRNPADPVPQEQPPTVNGDATPPAGSDASAALARGDSMVEGASGQAAGKAIDDAWITTKTKTALLAEADLKAGSIQVETRQGVVTLTGKVPSAEHSKKATAVVRGIEGVKDVDNKLAVTP